MKKSLMGTMVLVLASFSMTLLAEGAPPTIVNVDCADPGNGYDRFSTIEEGVDAVEDGGTVMVAPGLYDVYQITVSKGLNLLGSGSGVTIIDGGLCELDTDGTLRIDSPSGAVLVDGFTFQNPGADWNAYIQSVAVWNCAWPVTIQHCQFIGYGGEMPNQFDYGLYVYGNWDSGTVLIQNNDFEQMYAAVLVEDPTATFQVRNNSFRHLLPGDEGEWFSPPWAVQAYMWDGMDNSALLAINGNTFSGFGGVSVIVGSSYGTFTNVEVKNNTINAIGSDGMEGIIIFNYAETPEDAEFSGVHNASISGNTITGIGGADTYGIRVLGPNDNLAITHNTISGVTAAVVLMQNGDAPFASGVMVNYNNIIGNEVGIENGSSDPADVVNAEYNWWGSADGPADPEGTLEMPGNPSADVADMLNAEPAGQLGNPVSDNVDYFPWSAGQVPALNTLKLNVQSDSLYVQPGMTVTVDLDVLNLERPVVACQAFIGFEPFMLADGSALPVGGSDWSYLIYRSWDDPLHASGELDLSSAVGAGESQADATIVRITFTAGMTEGATQVFFRPDGTEWDGSPDDTRSTWLCDAVPTVILPVKVDGANIIIDGTPPEATITADPPSWTTGNSVDFTFSATDSLSGVAGYELRFTRVNPDLTETEVMPWFAAASVYTLDVSSFADSVHKAYVRATDRSGNQAEASVLFYLDKSPNKLELAVQPGSIYVKPNSPVDINLNVSHLHQEIVAVQAFIGYESSMLSDFSLTDGDGDWSVLFSSWNDPLHAAGELDMSAGVSLQTSGGTMDPNAIAHIAFRSQTLEGTTQVVFRPDGLEWDGSPDDTRSTWLCDAAGTVIYPTKVDSVNIVVDGTAPVPTITADPAGWTTASSVDFTFSATDPLSGVAGYELRFTRVNPDLSETEIVPWFAATSVYTLDVSACEDSVHKAYVRATDLSGNQGVASVNFYLDKSPYMLKLAVPTASLYVRTNEAFVINLDVSHLHEEIVAAQAFIGFEPSMLSGVSVTNGEGDWRALFSSWAVPGELDMSAGVSTQAQGGTMVPATISRITLTSLEVEGTTRLVFRPDGLEWDGSPDDTRSTWLCDPAGNVIYPTKVNSVDILIDGTPPEAAITADPSTWTSGNSVAFTFSASDALSGLVGCELRFTRVNPDLSETEVAGWFAATSVYTLDVASYIDGTYKAYVRATDLAGNQAVASANFYLDKTAPTQVSIVADPAGWTNADAVSFTLSANCGTSGLAGYELRFARVNPDLTETELVPWFSSASTYVLDVESYADGTCKAYVRATDTVGHQAEASTNFYLDKTAPTGVSIVADPSVWTSANTINLTLSADCALSGLDRYEVTVDSGSALDAGTSGSFALNVAATPDGDHTVTATAFDNAGNSASADTQIHLDKTAPVAFVVTASPDSWTNGPISVSFATTDATSGMNHYEVAIDAGAYSTQTSSYELPALADGTHTVHVKAIDNALNSRIVDVDVYADKTAPSIAIVSAKQGGVELIGTGVNALQGTVEIVVNAADVLPPDGSGLNGHPTVTVTPIGGSPEAAVFDSELPGGVFNYTWTVYGTTPNGIATINASVSDVAGNGATASPQEFNVTADITPPVPTISADPSTWTNANSVAFTFSATDDISGVAGYELRFTKVNPDLSETEIVGWFAATSVYTLEVESYADATYKAYVRATDRAGNQAEAFTSFYLDKSAPTAVSVVAEPAGWTSAGTIDLTLSANCLVSGLMKYELAVDSGTPVDAGTSGSYELGVGAMSDGTHTVTVTAFDNAGNSASADTQIRLDKTPPLAFAVTASPDSWTNGPITVSFATTDATSDMNHYEVAIDAGAWSTQISPYELPALADGTHTVHVKAIDNALNSTIADVTVYFDGTAPSIAITSAKQGGVELIGGGVNALQGTVEIAVNAADILPPNGSGLSGQPTVTITPNGGSPQAATFIDELPAGVFNYRWTVAASTPNGAATINASVSDVAGNTAAAAPRSFAVNKNRITGLVELQALSPGTQPSGRVIRTVTFKATNAGGTVLKTWNEALEFTTATEAYALSDVPAGTACLSAKTNWNLRRKLGAPLDADGQCVVNFTGTAARLLGGDINGSNAVNIQDYSLLKLNWYTSNPVADINGSGWVNILDYSIMTSNWFKQGSAE